MLRRLRANNTTNRNINRFEREERIKGNMRLKELISQNKSCNSCISLITLSHSNGLFCSTKNKIMLPNRICELHREIK